MKSRQVELTEFSEIITNYTRDFVGREWLVNEVNQLLADSECRFILLTGNTGVGKTAFLAHLASQNPQWLRYFIRRDSLNLMSPGDAATFLLTVGGQFATVYPELFLPKNVQINVDQEIGNVTANGKLTGIHIDEVYASPFYKVALDVKQKIDELKGEAFAIKIGRLIREPRLLPLQTLQFLALLDPARLLKIKEPETSLIILVDGLDELRYSPARPDILHALCELTDIPSNLRFIITSRPEQFLDQLLKRKDTKLFSLDTLELMEKKQADLQRYIHTLSKEE